MEKTALVIIDVQEALFLEEGSPIYKADEVLTNINKLIAYGRSKDLPIIFVQHNSTSYLPLIKGCDTWQIHSKLTNLPTDSYVDKVTPDAFYKTNLKALLDEKGIETLIICGLQTEFCVDTTIRNAFSLDYKMILASDAHSTEDAYLKASDIIKHHMNIWSYWFVDPKTTNEIIGM